MSTIKLDDEETRIQMLTLHAVEELNGLDYHAGDLYKMRPIRHAINEAKRPHAEEIERLKKDRDRYLVAFRHCFEARGREGDDWETCKTCGLNLRDEIHYRV